MIPLRDTPKTRKFPYVNTLLIIFNIFVFVQQLALTNEQLANVVVRYGLIPLRFSQSIAAGEAAAALAPLVTYQFMHGGWLHIGSNMLYLWVFGDNIEDRVGHLRYLIFYLLMGLLAGLLQVFLDAASPIPIIGASGAVAGILGAYLVSCPRARVLAIIPIFILFTITEVPAILFLGFWFILQLFSGFTSIGVNVSIAWWAHIGGFVAGMALIRFFGERIKCE
ncbi:MAG TPA: rhomboid family intramembrane serine protease [Oscillospiraceae bacterium]|nr:rhomboid family intramembrane serine protease [Oscillospiraceae bacterium]